MSNINADYTQILILKVLEHWKQKTYLTDMWKLFRDARPGDNPGMLNLTCPYKTEPFMKVVFGMEGRGFTLELDSTYRQTKYVLVPRMSEEQAHEAITHAVYSHLQSEIFVMPKNRGRDILDIVNAGNNDYDIINEINAYLKDNPT